MRWGQAFSQAPQRRHSEARFLPAKSGRTPVAANARITIEFRLSQR